MPKPTTGRVSHAPRGESRATSAKDQPRQAASQGSAKRGPRRLSTEEENQRNVAILMTSVFSGISLLAATIVLATAGTLVMDVVRRVADGPLSAEIGFALGLALATALAVFLLRRYATSIKRRSANLYRGIWIGTLSALVIIVFMAFLPQVVFPQYCPPGAICQGGAP